MTQTDARPASSGAAAGMILPLPSLAAIAGVGVGFAAWLPDSGGPGMFLPLVAGLAGTAVLLASQAPPSRGSIALGLAGLMLVAMTSIRDARWLAAPNLLFALVFAALAAAGPLNWTGALAGVLAPTARLLNVPGTLVRSFSAAAGSANPARAGRMVRGLALGLLLVAVFWALFASADRVFAQLTEALMPDWDLGLLPARAFLLAVAAGVTTAFALVRLAGPPDWLCAPIGKIAELPFKLGRVEWTAVLGLLNLLFLSFAIVQVVVLFQGHDHVLQTAGLTYAEYAREGFMQLLVAAALTIAVVVAIWTRSASSNGSERILLKALLGLLCLLTLLILGSALRRLGLYEEAFGFTRSRLTAHAFALWLGAVLVVIILAGAAGRTRWLFGATLGLTAAFLIGFSLLNPDAAIVERNWQRYLDTGKIDTAYLSELSADAVPAVVALPDEQLGERLLESLGKRVPDREPWSSANLSRIRARDKLEEQQGR